MSQNIYDDAGFYNAYRQLPRSRDGLAAAPEWDAVRALIPELEGSRILDLGCGFGAFARWCIEQGAASVIGVDLSTNMLNRARELTETDSIEYRIGDLEDLDIPEPNFELIYSALAFHYVEDFSALCRAMRSKLVQGGRLVATVEHPIFTAPRNDAWLKKDSGDAIWPLDRYFDEGYRERSWFTDGVIKYHRTIGTYVGALLGSSFKLTNLTEWEPTLEQVTEHPEWKLERERPMFLILSAEAV